MVDRSTAIPTVCPSALGVNTIPSAGTRVFCASAFFAYRSKAESDAYDDKAANCAYAVSYTHLTLPTNREV